VFAKEAQQPDSLSPGGRPLRIVLLSASYLPVLGGLQTVVHALARQFRARGHDVRVVTNRYPRRLSASETIDGVAVERWQFLAPDWRDLRAGRADLFAASLYYYPTVLGRLGRLLRTFRPDVVNIHFPDGQIPFLLPQCRRRLFRLVASLHGNEVMRYTGGEGTPPAPEHLGRGLKALMREADAVTACSPDLLAAAARLEPSVAAKGVAIYNGIDPERFADKTPYVHQRPYILAYGRLTRKKGFDLLLEAFARVGAEESGADLLLAGEGEERAALEALARRLGLTDRVHFLGRVEPAEVVRLLNGCLFLVVPSRAEPFGIVALEGLAAGKPVLATRVGGMGPFLAELRAARPELSVRLTEPTAESLACGLRELPTNPPGCGAPLGVPLRDAYSWARVAERYEHVLAGRAVPS
jgi:glycogen(starch) synthase